MEVEILVNVSVIFEDGIHWVHFNHPVEGQGLPVDWNIEGSTPSWFNLDMQPILDRADACVKAKELRLVEVEALEAEAIENGSSAIELFDIDDGEPYFIFATIEFRHGF